MPVMTEAEARLRTDRVKQSIHDARSDALALYEGHAWEPLKFPDWWAYLSGEFGAAGSWVDQLRRAAEVERRVIVPNPSVHAPMGGEIATRSFLALRAVPEERQSEAWNRAVETAPPTGLTAAHVASVAREYKPEMSEATRRAVINREIAAANKALGQRLLPLDPDAIAVYCDDENWKTFEHNFARLTALRSAILAYRSGGAVVTLPQGGKRA